MKVDLIPFLYTFVTVLLAVYTYYLYIQPKAVTEKDIAHITDEWLEAITVHHDPEMIYSMFCPDGNLVGTVSQMKRKGRDIKNYFEYFSKLQGIRVLSKQYNISRVSADVFLNTAFITWKWDGLNEPVVARMTFLFRDRCIFQLHSSKLPETNTKLIEVSGNS
jgi:hypothetical protein